ncbi:MAG: putative flap endonuclease-1-like 5' DNA nuclease [Gammaproteobacteria bacterium]|jgi:predicted flap endonuclease-1-like 5' DNA nuclease
MSYRIQEIEGIGPAYGQRLQDAGLTTTDALLKA